MVVTQIYGYIRQPREICLCVEDQADKCILYQIYTSKSADSQKPRKING